MLADPVLVALSTADAHSCAFVSLGAVVHQIDKRPALHQKESPGVPGLSFLDLASLYPIHTAGLQYVIRHPEVYI
ncbi:hypothetical protein [Herbaspirillum sp. 1173]|uniref:hypothetical protein n=1 Tax=Herbaspirillum sp. 1173 TaxID=2817734 RepID=UPI00286D568B|nr:hypothetical protein [Herbaspirillum sp. 1173]